MDAQTFELGIYRLFSVKRDNIPGVTVPKRSEMNSKVP